MSNNPNGIDWSYWANVPIVDYIDACILSRGFDPEAIEGDLLPSDLTAELERLKFIAKAHLGGKLPRHQTDANRSDRYLERDDWTGVKLAEFRAWGESLRHPLTFLDEFPRALPDGDTQHAAGGTRWPWGDHETKLLRAPCGCGGKVLEELRSGRARHGARKTRRREVAQGSWRDTARCRLHGATASRRWPAHRPKAAQIAGVERLEVRALPKDCPV